MSIPAPVTATYWIETDDPKAALTALCRGQSVGNPTHLTPYETPDFLHKWQATYKILQDSLEKYVKVEVKWPVHNFGHEGFNYLLSVLMGGQCDVDIIKGCRLVDLDLSSLTRFYPGAPFGIGGIRRILGVHGRALIGGIVKPKIGLSPQQVADVCKEMADGGVDFIKDDEILADQPWCPLAERVRAVAKALKGYKVLYAPCITGDGRDITRKARMARNEGATALHLNLWCGLGAFYAVRKVVNLPLFFQKSGDKCWTSGAYSIEYSVICYLAQLAGCDMGHIGMYGGYLAEQVGVLKTRIEKFSPALPSFSCGMDPIVAARIIQLFGTDVMLTSGGYIHSHPEGPAAGVRAMREVTHAVCATR